MTQIYPMLDYSSDHSLFSTTDSWTCFTPFDQPSLHNDASLNLSSPFQGQTSSRLYRKSHWDPTETSQTKVSGANTAKDYDCTISQRDGSLPSPLDSDGFATSSPVRDAYESENSRNPHSQSSATGKAISSKPSAPRKRGRSRRYASRHSTKPSRLSGDPDNALSSRIPHTTVERKYREGLNAALERLRQAVPTLPQRRQGGRIGSPRPSKSMIIAGAVDYIKRLESEKALALMENQTLRRVKG